MVTQQPLENPEQLAQEPSPAQEAIPKEWRLSIRIDREALEHITLIANYAAEHAQVIPNNPKGNLTAWVNYCLELGEEQMKQHANQ